MLTNENLARQAAMEQAERDFPYTTVLQGNIFRYIPDAENAPHQRWYVEIELQHTEDDTIGWALYRVWHDEHGTFETKKITIV